jgi:hypothetical protein
VAPLTELGYALIRDFDTAHASSVAAGGRKSSESSASVLGHYFLRLSRNV